MEDGVDAMVLAMVRNDDLLQMMNAKLMQKDPEKKLDDEDEQAFKCFADKELCLDKELTFVEAQEQFKLNVEIVAKEEFAENIETGYSRWMKM